MTEHETVGSPTRLRRTGLSLAVWVFSVCTTLLLIGLWGRAVASDQVTLEESTRAVLESELVNDRVVAWLGEGFAAAEARSGSDAARLADRLEAAPEMQLAVDNLIDVVVTAALAPPGESSVIDVATVLAPVMPIVLESMDQADAAIGLDSIQSTVDELSAVVLPAPAGDEPVSVAAGAVSVLSTVVIMAVIGMLITAGAAMWLSAEPIAQLRALAIRLSVSAVTFAVILRAGSWAVDPSGGRSPIAAGGAVLLASNGLLLALVALGAGAGAGVLTLWVRRRRIRSSPVS